MILLYGYYVFSRLTVRLNRITRIKWSLAVLSICMRVGLSITEFCKRSYNYTSITYYYVFLIDQIHFMILLTLFFTVIGSWKLIFSFSAEQKDKVKHFESSQTGDYKETLEKLREQKRRINLRSFVFQGVYFVLSLILTVQLQVI